MLLCSTPSHALALFKGAIMHSSRTATLATIVIAIVGTVFASSHPANAGRRKCSVCIKHVPVIVPDQECLAKLAECEQTNIRLTGKIEQIRQRMIVCCSDRDELAKQLTDVTSELDTFKQKVRRLRGKLITCQQDGDTVQSEIDNLNVEIASCNKLVEAKQEEIATLKNWIEKKGIAIEDLKREKTECEQQLARSQEALNACTAAKSDIAKRPFSMSPS